MSDIKKCKCDGHWHKDAMVENNDTYLCVVCASKEITRLQAENEELQLTNREYYTELEDEKRKVGLLRIENEELKKRLEISEGAFGSKSRLLDLAQDEITHLQAENGKLRQAMEWISVKDRLPERSSQDVITCIHYGNRYFAYEYENYYLPDTNEWANPLHKWTHWTKAILPPEVD